MKQLLIFVIFCASTISSHAENGPKQLDSGTKLYSPDGKLFVVYNPDQLEIRDAKTDYLYNSVGALPVQALRWTRDSKTLVVVEQIAHGSEVGLVHFNGAQWERFTVLPPGQDYKDFAVVGLKPEHALVQISYRATGAALYVISFTVNPSNQVLSNVQKKEVSFKQWIALRMVGAK